MLRPKPTASPAAITTLHLYRHILRQVSYLPPAFRATIDSIIRDRFHRHRKYDPRAKAHISRAQSALRKIRAANAGDRIAMEALISKGFGRSGARRRELMSQFVKPQGPDDSKALEDLLSQADEVQPNPESQLEAKSAKAKKNAFFEKWDQPKIIQLLQSQKRQQGETKGTASWPGTAVKTIDENQFVPETNIWGKPPGEGLVQTRRAHWWRRNAEKVMPPLGKGEWDLLSRLSNGAQEKGEWVLPQRRIAAKPVLADDDAGAESRDWAAYATNPAAVVERPKTAANQRRTGQRNTGPYGTKLRERPMSDRWFRRAYNRVWQLTPSMEQDPNTLKYSVAWGSAQSRLPTPTKMQLDIFDGVDKKGSKIGKD